MTVRREAFCHEPLTSLSPPSWPGARMSSRLVCPRFVHVAGTVPAVANVLSWVMVGLVAVPTTPVQMEPTPGIKTAASVCAILMSLSGPDRELVRGCEPHQTRRGLVVWEL